MPRSDAATSRWRTTWSDAARGRGRLSESDLLDLGAWVNNQVVWLSFFLFSVVRRCRVLLTLLFVFFVAIVVSYTHTHTHLLE